MCTLRFGGCLLFASACAADPNGAWLDSVAAPLAVQEVGVGVVGGELYVVAGFNQSRQSVNDVMRFDPVANDWEFVAPLPAPQPLNHVGCVGVDGKLFVVGGLRQNFSAVDTVYCFDPSTGAWLDMAPMPSARGAMGVAAVGGTIYAAGGLPASRSNRFASYDVATDSWTELPVMPTPREHLAAAAVDGVFYALSGRNFGVLLPQVEAFDPVENTWRAIVPIPTARAGIAAAAFDGRIFVFGGEGNGVDPTGSFEEVEVLDPRRNLWSTMPPMPLARHGIGAGVLAGRIHIPVGGPIQGFSTTTHHDSFEPDVLCRGDADCDGDIDIVDLLTFLAFWFDLDFRAERTGDFPHSVDVADLLAFLADWFAGGCS